MERLFCLAALLAVGLAATGSFNYVDQASWGGTCNTGGKRQSPIAISSGATVNNDRLLNLTLARWNQTRDGVFKNIGTSVKFTPNGDEPFASTTNHLGEYNVLQFHMHWGAMDDVGSEHVVDKIGAAAEIHFVHQKVGDTTGAEGDSFAVVGVMAVADDIPISGVWSALDVQQVQASGGKINATVNFYDLLPSDLPYYYYMGSLTTPGCTEVVQWFVLQNTISIPRAYLEQLRQVQENADGDLLTFNYRDTQDLAGREVAQFPATETTDGGSIVRLNPLLLAVLPVFLLALLL